MIKAIIALLLVAAAAAQAQNTSTFTAWGECSGTGEAGCPEGYACVETSPGFYQCRNDQLAQNITTMVTSTTMVNTTDATNTTGTTSTNGTSFTAWGQCSGLFATGCPEGYACVETGTGFFQCRNDQLAQNATAAAGPQVNMTSGSNMTYGGNASTNGTTFAAWGQCSGLNAAGCPEGYACVETGTGFFQCRNDQLAKNATMGMGPTANMTSNVTSNISASNATLEVATAAASPMPSPRPSPAAQEMTNTTANTTMPTVVVPTGEAPMNTTEEEPALDTGITPMEEEPMEEPAEDPEAPVVLPAVVNATEVPPMNATEALATMNDTMPAMNDTMPAVNATENGTAVNATPKVEVTKQYGSVAAALAAVPQLTALNKLVTANNLTAALANTSLEATVFGPNNDAIASASKYLQENNQTLNETQMQSLLTYHVVPGAGINSSRLASLVAENNGTLPLKTLQGEDIIVTSDAPENATMDTLVQEAGRLRRLFAVESATVLYINNDTKILGGDVRAGKAYVHVINRVLVPESLYPYVNEQEIETAPTNDTLGELPTEMVPAPPPEAPVEEAPAAEEAASEPAPSSAATAAWSMAALALPLALAVL